jgi:hypothetical protein
MYHTILALPCQASFDVLGLSLLDCQNPEQIVVISTSHLALGLDSTLEALILLEQVQGNVSQDGKVLCPIAFTHTTIIFSESDI